MLTIILVCHHVDFLHAIKLVVLISILTFLFPTTESLLILYFASIRCELEYASVAWNPIRVTDCSKI
jgi:hypothetical protein